jgi:hypothetical protein
MICLDEKGKGWRGKLLKTLRIRLVAKRWRRILEEREDVAAHKRKAAPEGAAWD